MKQVKKNVILHIAYISNDYTSGVSTVVPQLLNWQSKAPSLRVALLNLTEYTPSNATFPVFFSNRLSNLPAPFNKPDLVVFHEIYRTRFLPFFLELKKSDVNYIITPHGSLNATAQKQHHFAKTILNIAFFNKFVRQAQVVHFLSEREMNQSNKFETKGRCIIPNGVPMPARLSSNPPQKKDIVFIGRLDVYVKGLDLLVEAAAQVADDLKKHKVAIKIYGPDCKGSMQELQSQIDKKGLSELCKLCGPVDATSKGRVLSDALCYIQLSRTEGFPTSIIEALSYGLPIIVSEGTTWKDLAEVYGVGFGVSNDVGEIGEKIIAIVNNPPLRQSMAKNATKVVKKHFQWSAIAENYEKFYSEVISHNVSG